MNLDAMKQREKSRKDAAGRVRADEKEQKMQKQKQAARELMKRVPLLVGSEKVVRVR